MERAILPCIVLKQTACLAPFAACLVFGLASGLVLALAPEAHAGPLAPLPGTQNAPPPRPPSTALSVVERLSRGVVTIEQGGRVIAVGSVLAGDGDGRILTSLSPMGSSEVADVRYADGSVVHARIGHRDKAWDLALLIPTSGKWTDGLVASMTSPVDAQLQAPVALHPGRPVVVPARVRGLVDARAHDGTSVLPSALDIELQTSSPTLGAPLTDNQGNVVGVFVKACQATLPVVPPSNAVGPAPAAAAAAPCVPIVVAAPIAAIRDFLIHAPATAVIAPPWLGIVGTPDTESNTHGVRVMAVAPGSPAQTAGLKANDDRAQADLIVAADGSPVDSPEHLADIIARHAPGDHVKLLLLTAGKFREATVTLRTAP
jgi:serine protease Do